jgi:hypothetical protein
MYGLGKNGSRGALSVAQARRTLIYVQHSLTSTIASFVLEKKNIPHRAP